MQHWLIILGILIFLAPADSEYKKANFNYKKFNLLSENYNDLIDWSKPDIIIHCAAITNGNLCGKDPYLALNVNGLSLKKLLLAIKQRR